MVRIERADLERATRTPCETVDAVRALYSDLLKEALIAALTQISEEFILRV
jgi:hypothetical protein